MIADNYATNFNNSKHYERTTRFEYQIFNAQDGVREAFRLIKAAEKHPEGSTQHAWFMELAEKAYREGVRYYRAAANRAK